MTDTFPIAFVGGGQMAAALIGALLRAGWAAQDILVIEPSEAQRANLAERFDVRIEGSAGDCIRRASVVVWAVKPQVMHEAAKQIRTHISDPLHVSIAAGLTLSHLGQCLQSQRVVRAMPNTPAQVGAGVTGLLSHPDLSEHDKSMAQRIMSAAGSVTWVDTDAGIDAVTAISGSGPAYVFQFLESYQAAAQSLGFTADEARRLVLDTMSGALQLARADGAAFTDLRKRVTSKNGTTEAALAVFAQHGFDAMVRDVVVAAQQRAIAISREVSSACR